MAGELLLVMSLSRVTIALELLQMMTVAKKFITQIKHRTTNVICSCFVWGIVFILS